MINKVKLAVLAASMVGAACSPDALTSIDPGGAKAPLQSSSTPQVVPISFTIVPTEVVGGGSGTPSGTVAVDSAVSFDRTLNVSSNNSAVLPSLSSSTVVPAFSTRANVQLVPSTVSVPTVVTVFVSGGGVTLSANLTVDPPGTAAPAPTLSAYTVSPGTVNAGTTATGTVTVPSPAPAGGVVVSLGSRVPGSATVPATVTVPQGATSVSFPISTFAGSPNSTTSVLLSASNANTFIQSSITVVTGGTSTTPAASTPLAAPALLSPTADQRLPAGSNVSFDWSDVSGAASYTLQVDNKDTFPSPLIVNQTVTTSQFSAGGLPKTTMWWRVRANSADGTAGTWSAARRFELK
jgi:hypothetical protein